MRLQALSAALPVPAVRVLPSPTIRCACPATRLHGLRRPACPAVRQGRPARYPAASLSRPLPFLQAVPAAPGSVFPVHATALSGRFLRPPLSPAARCVSGMAVCLPPLLALPAARIVRLSLWSWWYRNIRGRCMI